MIPAHAPFSRISAVVAGLALALSLTACGGGSSSASTTTDTATVQGVATPNSISVVTATNAD